MPELNEATRAALEAAHSALLAAQPRDIHPPAWASHEQALNAVFAALHPPASASSAQQVDASPFKKFKPGDLVHKTKGAQWKGRVVGFYSTTLTPEGYAVESSTEHGSVQIYPAAALELDGGAQ